MTVILMLAMFAIFLTIDYLRKGKEAAQTAEARLEAVTTSLRPMPTIVAGFDLPENRSYHQGHTWALQESPTLVRVGIDDFGARLAGKIDEIVLPKRGQWVRQGQRFVTLVRDGQKTELVSPVEGEVMNVNGALTKDAALSNSDPYGQGWLVSVVSPDATTTFRNLLSGSLARKWMAEASHRLQVRAPMLAGAVAQDGGVAVHDLTLHLPTEQWSQITREFFLT
jgi:glycine cleavage system H lipoate-binding protein